MDPKVADQLRRFNDLFGLSLSDVPNQAEQRLAVGYIHGQIEAVANHVGNHRDLIRKIDEREPPTSADAVMDLIDTRRRATSNLSDAVRMLGDMLQRSRDLGFQIVIPKEVTEILLEVEARGAQTDE